ncbi:uncharacterized protein LOC144359635 [Saccoglossus kowalevskii]
MERSYLTNCVTVTKFICFICVVICVQYIVMDKMPIQMHNSQGPPIFVMNKSKGFKSNTINSDKTEIQNRRQNLIHQKSNSDKKENKRKRQNIIKQTSNSDKTEIQKKRQGPIQQKSFQYSQQRQNKIITKHDMILNDTLFLNARNVSLVRHNVTGDSYKQGPLYGFLKPHDEIVVPNIAHFIWFSCHQFRFVNLISILSAHRIMQAERILFHTDCEPDNELWIQAKLLIPVLKVVNRVEPTAVFNQTLNPKWHEHSADVARLQILKEMGGVYLDTTIVLAPLEPLRHYDYVVGQPEPTVLSNGIIFAEKHSRFLNYYYDSYRKYNSICWGCSSVVKQYELAKSYVDMLHIEPSSLIGPKDWRAVLLNNYHWQNRHFTIHVYIRYYRGKKDFTAENIRYLNTAFGEICRYIYYGSPAMSM